MCFSDFVPSPESRHFMGFVCCGVVVLHMLFNFGAIFLVNLSEVQRKVKAKRLVFLMMNRVAKWYKQYKPKNVVAVADDKQV